MKNKMQRLLVLPLLMIFVLAATLPFDDSLASRGKGTHVKRASQHSRAWWRRRRAVLRRRRLLAARRQTLARIRRQQAAKLLYNAASRRNRPDSITTTTTAAVVNSNFYPTADMVAASNTLAGWTSSHNLNVTVPALWTSAGVNSDLQFFVRGTNGQPAGTAVLAPIAPPRSLTSIEAVPRHMRRMVGGVPVADLRRMVIDRMVAEGGWVLNDSVRETPAGPVYVVLAQTDASSVAASTLATSIVKSSTIKNSSTTNRKASRAKSPPTTRFLSQTLPLPERQQQSWAFYFTAINNQVYSLATAAPLEFAGALAADSEEVLASLRKLERTVAVTPVRTTTKAAAAPPVLTTSTSYPAPTPAVLTRQPELLEPPTSASPNSAGGNGP